MRNLCIIFIFCNCRIEGNEELKLAMQRVNLRITTLTRVTTQIQGQKVEGIIKYNSLRHNFLIVYEKRTT